ncbi:DDE superfamily endonuclease [Phytophthora infestans]|uniref:DDE superfamily endonuclease n=1 Tax=Phytophthora infestans TaxID=4787 RepID=A0A833W7E9_PHYIN|nr:DDE superfamily endonuclease [Phytophthora infestans]
MTILGYGQAPASLSWESPAASVVTQEACRCGIPRTSKGWMTVPVFQDWLKELDRRMGHAGRKILFLLDNAPVHIAPETDPDNVELLFLPPNTTAAIQPMDQGVIAWVKRRVLNDCGEEAVWKLCCEEDPFTIETSDAVMWCNDAWNALDADTIKACWRHAGQEQMVLAKCESSLANNKNELMKSKGKLAQPINMHT